MGLGPTQILGAGAAGFVAGGVPGAAAAVAAAVVGSFFRPKDPLTFAGTPKESLEIPWFNLLRPQFELLGREWISFRFQSGERIIRDDQVARRRAGELVAREMFFRLPVSSINEILQSGTELPTAQLSDTSTVLEEDVMVFNPVTGIDQPPERVDRGRYNEGLGNELVSQPQAKALAPSIVPVIELGRYINHPQVQGATRAYSFNTLIIAGGTTTLIRIPGDDADGGTIYVKNASWTISPSTGVSATYQLHANAARPASTAPVHKMHFQVLRQTTGLSVDGSLSDGQAGEFSVPIGLDYVVVIVNGAPTAIRIGINVEAFFIPKGVVGSHC